MEGGGEALTGRTLPPSSLSPPLHHSPSRSKKNLTGAHPHGSSRISSIKLRYRGDAITEALGATVH